MSYYGRMTVHERLARLLAIEEMERRQRPLTASPPRVEDHGRYNRSCPGGVRAYTPPERGEDE